MDEELQHPQSPAFFQTVSFTSVDTTGNKSLLFVLVQTGVWLRLAKREQDQPCVYGTQLQPLRYDAWAANVQPFPTFFDCLNSR